MNRDSVWNDGKVLERRVVMVAKQCACIILVLLNCTLEKWLKFYVYFKHNKRFKPKLLTPFNFSNIYTDYYWLWYLNGLSIGYRTNLAIKLEKLKIRHCLKDTFKYWPVFSIWAVKWKVIYRRKSILEKLYCVFLFSLSH